MKASPNPTDKSSSHSFTSLLTVLGSNSWRPPWGMEKYLRGILNWSPFSRHLTDESSLDRRVVTRPTSRHSADESSLDRRVVTRPFCRHSTVLSSLGAERSLTVTRFDLRSRLARSLAQQGLAKAYPYLTYPSWLHDESSRKQLARALAATRLDLSRSLARTPYSAQNDLSQSLRSLSPRGVDVSFCRHPIDESSLDRRILIRPTSRHSTVLSSLDRRVFTRPTSRHSTDESSLDRRAVTRPFCRHSTILSSLDRLVIT
ncbi:hypothetical protein F2Q68_00045223 [Brassica cretica]|uniref:Uncharacterized protein n=1 Tax=Brassica cretica TaxID=69181 RepID=A0A8S9LIV5_BRACR|nr:hypothetical protein F2Q68_00045223 [Brassica cretica]